METIKLNITIDKDWLEATWTEDETVLHCESFSGHNEHIEMLKDKCLEFNTELTEEHKVIVNEISEAYIYPTEEEIVAEELTHKINEAKFYLANTDYKMTVDYFATLSEAEQIELTAKRAEAREFVRANEVKGGN